ncbi:MAG: 2Fe-2S iron-sulfur cluster-binding protein [Gammaproteobacteria bacterium]
MSFTVNVRQFAEPLRVEVGATVLEAALAQRLPYPHGCRSGNCGACKSRLYQGEIELAPYSRYALTDAERAAGLILACRAVPWSDCEVAFLDADEFAVHPLRRLDCRVSHLDRMTHDIMRLQLVIEAGGPFSFAVGQYATLGFDGCAPRDYSMANQPGGDVLEFHVRALAGGSVSRYVHDGLRIGARVAVAGPYGMSYLRESHTGPILALAGGSGLAPIKAIVERALALGMSQDIRFYFGVRDERDLYLEDHFLALAERHPNLHFTPVLSEPSAPTTRRVGYLADVVAADGADLDGCKTYLAGPPIMVETCVTALKRLGMRAEDCHADAFYTEAEKVGRELVT